ncbi:hypothetical protein VRB78_23040 [Pseudomonas trivialis]|uniref:hypothetical protein n=1 Tax=Pseudomonas trivialis TaxID=200450 RepID=UPI0030D02B9A
MSNYVGCIMPFKYRLLSKSFDVYGSDFYTNKLENGMNFDPENTLSAANTQNNNPNVIVRYLGGMGLVMPFSVLPVAPKTGDEWTVDILNVTTNDPAAVFSFTKTIDAGRNSKDVREFLNMPSIKVLGAGVIEINCNFTSSSANTVYVFQPIKINLILS